MIVATSLWLAVASLAGLDETPVLPPPSAHLIDYAKDVQPLLSQSCTSCHGAKKRHGGLSLHRNRPAMGGGDEGNDILPGNSAGSRLIRYVGGLDEDHPMPPEGFGDPLTPEQVGVLRAWIDQGADWSEEATEEAERSDHWSFRQPIRPELPAVREGAWPKNPVDRFVLFRLEANGLRPSPEADRAVLIRRLGLDLIGLPPTVAEVDAFVADDRPDAYERLVDRLLASPHYGERWARRWLDLARYADTNGYEKDRERSIWPYRDWVIRALNEDMPFDRFTIEQIAGDLLPNATVDQKVATGFHRNTMINEEGGIDVEEFRFASIVDRVATTGATWLGLTVQCAQCHTHKYDPITQREYYNLFAFFDDTDEPEIDLSDPAIAARRAEVEEQLARLEAGLAGRFPETGLDWTILPPSTVAADSGSKLEIRPDGSVLASGPIPETDGYRAEFELGDMRIDAIRLEALTDPTLPRNGPGRAPSGNFVLVNLAAVVVGLDGQETPLVLGSPAADVEQKGFGVRNAIDDNKKTGWAVDVGPDRVNSNHSATFQVLPYQETCAGSRLIVRLDQSYGGQHALGRFRISVGRTPEPIPGTVEERRAHRLGRKFAEWQADLKPFRWTVATPSSVASAKGATMTVLPDRSVLVSGDKPNNDTYRIEIPVGSAPITAIRVETLPHESLPEGGPGRAPPLISVGNFMLTEVRAEIFPGSEPSGRPVALRQASADFEEADRPASAAIDGRVDTGWSIGEALGRPHAIVLRLAEPLTGLSSGRLVLTLEQQSIHQMTIGRFRVSTTDQDEPSASGLPAEIEEAAILAPSERSVLQTDLLLHYFLKTTPELAEAQREIADLRHSMPRYSTTLVMQARPASAARITRIRRRGEFLRPADAVAPAVPAVLHSLPDGAKADRLTLARWLVADNNPLVGRVVMNRVWMAFFGRGLVATPEDFGTRGERPTHPELLDWLATEFHRQGWSQKAMHRLIVTSATYRQSSTATREFLAIDPRNERLARGPRFRVDAEVIRDAALAAAGLLDLRIGGQSVFPPQPEGVTSLGYGEVGWPTSQGSDRFRRGLYTYSKRTTPFAAFATFDAPPPDLACVRRERSNTPLQALTLMNDPAMVEAARGLGRRIIDEGPVDAEGRAALGFRLVMGRRPGDDEIRLLVDFADRQMDRIKQGQLKPVEINGGGSEDADLATWTTLARAILNLDEAVNKE